MSKVDENWLKYLSEKDENKQLRIKLAILQDENELLKKKIKRLELDHEMI